MKISIYKKTACYFFAIVVLVFCSLFASCKPRQTRIIQKVIHDVEHATGADRNNDYSEENVAQQQNARFSITGIVQYDNGRIFNLTPDNGPVLYQTEDGLFLGNEIQKSVVYNNEYATITETYDLPDNSEYEYSFGETATRSYNVGMYQFVCPMSDRTYYFSVKGMLN